jgi:UDP-N-acetylmuramyl pentapeptide phosphotransferase/UDP-N-acetylglucosamine-1-phosphate transferase
MTPLAAEAIISLVSAVVTLVVGYSVMRAFPSAQRRPAFIAQAPFAAGIAIGCVLYAITAGSLFGGDRFHGTSETILYCVLVCAVCIAFIALDWRFPGQGDLQTEEPGRPAQFRGIALLLAVCALATAACIAGVRFSILGLAGNPNRELGVWAGPLTAVWLVGCAFAVKLLDGLDGAAHLLLIGACTAIFYATYGTNERFLNAFSLLVGAVSASALRFSLYPARMRVAGGGTLCLGFLFAMLMVFARQKTVAAAVFLIPVLAIALVAGGAMLTFLEKQFTAERK